MIRVSAYYPNQPDGTFDHEYYNGPHRKMVSDRLTPGGLRRFEMDRGLAGYGGGPAPYLAVVHFVFDSLDAFQNAWGPHADVIMSDIPNFTNTQPVVQISEIVSM